MTNGISGKCLLDTNILIYIYDKKSPFHQEAKNLILQSAKGTFDAIVAQQNLIEFCNILNRDYRISFSSITEDIKDILQDLTVVAPFPTTAYLFLNILKKHKKQTRNIIFDLYLAATMLDNGIKNIITANEKDFAGIREISAHNPF